MSTPKKPLTPEQDEMLNAVFAAARDVDPGASPELLARVLTDAEAVQAAHGTPAAVVDVPWTAQLWANLGGWVGAGGLVTAAVAGLLIGLSPPVLLQGLASPFAAASPALFDATELFAADALTDL